MKVILSLLAAVWQRLRRRDTVLMANAQIDPALILPPISFGLDVRQPARLETRGTGAVLRGILRGDWREPVARVRELPADSQEQREAKLALPFCTWAGVFTRRSNSGLVRHSGQCGVDLDGLGEAGAVTVLQTAVADCYCLAAFHSARAEGIRLIFKIPPCSPEDHVLAFEQVVLHVRNTYGHDPDASGKDVSRASFVSFDRGLWLNPSALELPIALPGETQRLRANTRCVSSPLYAGLLAETWPVWYGRHLANTSPCKDGTAKTHGSLLDLGKSLALHAERIREPLTHREIDAAFSAWLSEHARLGICLRCEPDEYRRELRVSIRGAERKPWFKSAADFWLRWTRHRDFPRNGLPVDRILFAIRQHCADAKSTEFFLGVRDAALVAGVGYVTGWRILCKLVASGHLKRLDAKRLPREAQEFRLKTKQHWRDNP